MARLRNRVSEEEFEARLSLSSESSASSYGQPMLLVNGDPVDVLWLEFVEGTPEEEELWRVTLQR